MGAALLAAPPPGGLLFLLFGLIALSIPFITTLAFGAANRDWEDEASRLGLEFKKADFLGRGRRIEGEFHGFPVCVETFERDGRVYTLLTLDTRDRIYKGIQLVRELSWSSVEKVFTCKEILIGDREFDAAVNVSGPETIAVALLGEDARSAVRRLISSTGVVINGCVYLETAGTLSESGQIRDALGTLVKFVSDLPAVTGKVAERLLANATRDRVPGVRQRNLRVLAEWFPTKEETKRAAQAALSDPDHSIRLLAATMLEGAESKAALKALLEDATIDDDLRRYAVLAAGASKDASLLAPLCALAPRRDTLLAQAVATALGQLGNAEAENTLLRLMSRNDVEVKHAAAAALGLVGTIRAVEPLLLLAQGPVAEIARDAVRRIQAKLGDAESGRLSIAAQEAAVGGLSIPAGGGEVSAASEGAGKGSGDVAVPRHSVKG